MLRRIPARPEQTESNSDRFPLFAYAGRCAAELWLSAPPLSMGEFRDLRFRNLIAGNPSLLLDTERRTAFNDAFARHIAVSIAQESRSTEAQS